MGLLVDVTSAMHTVFMSLFASLPSYEDTNKSFFELGDISNLV